MKMRFLNEQLIFLGAFVQLKIKKLDQLHKTEMQIIKFFFSHR